MKIKNRTFTGIFLGSLAALVLTLILISSVMYSALKNEAQTEIKNEALYISESLNLYKNDRETLSVYINEMGKKAKIV